MEISETGIYYEQNPVPIFFPLDELEIKALGLNNFQRVDYLYADPRIPQGYYPERVIDGVHPNDIEKIIVPKKLNVELVHQPLLLIKSVVNATDQDKLKANVMIRKMKLIGVPYGGLEKINFDFYHLGSGHTTFLELSAGEKIQTHYGILILLKRVH